MGKFSSSNKNNPVDIYTILAEREAKSRKKPAVSAPAMAPMPMPEKAVIPKPIPRPIPQPIPQPVAPEGKKPSVMGTMIFWLCCLAFVFLFYVGTFVGLNFLRDWLVKFEAAQPTVKCQQVFDELFADPDWAALYQLSGMESAGYEGAEAFETYMDAKVAGQELTYLETSAGLSGDKKYVVWLGDEKLATFTLEDQNDAQGMTAVPDWQLGTVEFFLEGQERFRILLVEGSTAYVNGIALTEDQVVARRTSRADDYLPTFAPRTALQILEVNGMLTVPTVEIRDAQGQSVAVAYDAQTATFSQELPQEELPRDRQNLALKALETYALYMSGKATRADVGKYFDKTSETYASIMEADLNWIQKGSDYTFTDRSVTDYRTHGEDIFSVRVSVDLNITRKEDGSVKTTDITQSMFFAKNSSGDWLCYEMTAVDASQWLEQVRLVFTQDGQILSDAFVDADSASVSCPLLSVPEGKTFKGWTVEDRDEQGNPVLRLVFTPDDSGVMNLPAGTVLEPMVLSPFFE